MRKSLLLVVAFALGVCGTGTTWAGNPPEHPAASIAGTWAVSLTYYYEGTESGLKDNLQYLQQFDRDGRAVIYLPQVAGASFDESRTACAGDWKPRGHRTFDVTLYCMWNEQWTDAPTVPDRILMKVTLRRDGRSWTATPFYYQPFAAGEYNGGPGWGAMQGVRLPVVPLP
jgi:hypothetical protein